MKIFKKIILLSFIFLITSCGTIKEGFKTRDELMDWCMDMQPYYKKHIPEVYNYFLKQTKL